jgi:hypothetical protein
LTLLSRLYSRERQVRGDLYVVIREVNFHVWYPKSYFELRFGGSKDKPTLNPWFPQKSK